MLRLRNGMRGSAVRVPSQGGCISKVPGEKAKILEEFIVNNMSA
jgi:hypothetical protein